MKNLIIILCLLCVANYSFAQYPQPPQNLGGLNIAVRDTGGLIIRQTLVPPSYYDTTAANVNSFTSRYPGSLIYTYSDNIFWLRNSTATRWLNFFTGSASGQDTLFAELPAFFDSTTRPGSTILKILTKNGLISGGTVTVDSCNILDIMPTIVVLNYIQYSSDAIKLTVPPNASGFPRVDEVIDSLGTIVLRIGTPSSTPVGAPINPATEWVLATYQIAAGATCVDVNQIIVWDQNVGTPTEWNLTTSGTITANGNNIDQPYHLTKAIFVSTYTSGSSLIFTYSSLLTAQATELFKFWVYLNGAFGSNQFIIQFLNGSTPVGIAAAFNSGFGFNPNDSNFYQQVVLPFSAFNLTNQQFDKVVITFQGNDLSGAKGLYLDYLQLQTGVINPGIGRGVLDFVHFGTDSIRLTTDDGRTFTVFDRGGGGAAITLQTNSVNNGSQTLLNLKQGTNTTIVDDGSGGVTINSTASGTGSTNSNIGAGYRLAIPNTNNIKTLFCVGCTVDSTTNANALTFTTTTGTVTNVAALTLGTTGTDLNSSVANPTTTPVITLNVPTASATNRGALSSPDWIKFDSAYVNATAPTDSTLNLRRLNGTSTTVTIRGGGTVLNGTGYVKMAGTTPSYIPQIPLTTDVTGVLPIANGGTNNGALSVTSGNLFYGDGTKFVSLGIGTSKQKLSSVGGVPAWLDSTAVTSFTGWNTTGGNTGFAFPDTTSLWIGTNNSGPMVFRLNNNYAALLDNLNNSFKVRISTVTKTDSSSVILVPHPTTPYIQFQNSINGSSFFTNIGSNIFTLGTAIAGKTAQLQLGFIVASNTASSSSFNVTSGPQNFNIGGSTDLALVFLHSGLTNIGVIGASSGSQDLQVRMNSASSITTGTQAVRFFNTSQHVNIGSTTTDLTNVLFAVNGQPNATNTYQTSVPFPKMTSTQRDSVITGIVQGGWTVTNAGTGYTPGSYVNQVITGGTGAGGHANITVGAGGTVSVITITDAGGYYTSGDALSASLPAGSGFVFTLTSVSSTVVGAHVFNTTTNQTDMSTTGTSWLAHSAYWGYIAKTGTYSATNLDYTIDCTSGTFTVTLPTAVGIPGRIYVISNSGAGTITVGTTSSQTFANVAATPTTLTMAVVGSRTVQSNGANWLLISSL